MHSLESAVDSRTTCGKQPDVWTSTTDDPVEVDYPGCVEAAAGEDHGAAVHYEPDYHHGYAHGKEKAYTEIRPVFRLGNHAAECACELGQLIREIRSRLDSRYLDQTQPPA